MKLLYTTISALLTFSTIIAASPVRLESRMKPGIDRITLRGRQEWAQQTAASLEMEYKNEEVRQWRAMTKDQQTAAIQKFKYASIQYQSSFLLSKFMHPYHDTDFSTATKPSAKIVAAFSKFAQTWKRTAIRDILGMGYLSEAQIEALAPAPWVIPKLAASADCFVNGEDPECSAYKYEPLTATELVQGYDELPESSLDLIYKTFLDTAWSDAQLERFAEDDVKCRPAYWMRFNDADVHAFEALPADMQNNLIIISKFNSDLVKKAMDTTLKKANETS